MALKKLKKQIKQNKTTLLWGGGIGLVAALWTYKGGLGTELTQAILQSQGILDPVFSTDPMGMAFEKFALFMIALGILTAYTLVKIFDK